MPPEHAARATATSISTPSGPLHVSVSLTEGSQSVGSTLVGSTVHERSTAYKPVNVICVRLKAANRAHRAVRLRSIDAQTSNPRQSRGCRHWAYHSTCVRFDRGGVHTGRSHSQLSRRTERRRAPRIQSLFARHTMQGSPSRLVVACPGLPRTRLHSSGARRMRECRKVAEAVRTAVDCTRQVVAAAADCTHTMRRIAPTRRPWCLGSCRLGHPGKGQGCTRVLHGNSACTHSLCYLHTSLSSKFLHSYRQSTLRNQSRLHSTCRNSPLRTLRGSS